MRIPMSRFFSDRTTKFDRRNPSRRQHSGLSASGFAGRLLFPFLFCALLHPGIIHSALRTGSAEGQIDPAAFEHFVNGDLYELSRDLDRAVREYERAKALQPEVTEIRIALAKAYLMMNRMEPAKAELLEIESKDAQGYFLLAESYRGLGQTDSAIWAYDQSLQQDSMYVNSMWRLAEGWQIKGDTEKVILYLKKIASLQTLSVRVHLQLAGQLFQATRYDEAISEYKRILQISPKETEALLGLGQSYEVQGDLDSAIESYRSLLELQPDNQRLRDQLIALYYKADRVDEAVKEAEKSSTFAPANQDVQKRLAILYLVQGDLHRAESLLVEYVKENPEDAEAHFHLGKIALSNEDLSKAELEFQTAVLLEDTVPDGWINLAYVYLRQDSTEKAIQTYERGIQKTNSKTELLLRLGSVYADQGQYDTALAILRRASDNRPHDSDILFALGSVYEQSGDFDRSVATFERLLRIDPDHATALNYLGYMLADKGIRLEESLEMIQRAVEHEPNNGAYLDSYGWVLYRLGRLKEAEAQLKKALEEMKIDPIIHEHLGDVYNAAGEIDKAKIEWKKSLELDPENQELKKKLGI